MQQRTVMKTRILIALSISLFACNREEIDPLDDTVHLAGFISVPAGNAGGSTTVGSYWRDGVYSALTNSDTPSRVTSMYVDGSSVLMGGWKWFASDPVAPSKVVVWYNLQDTVVDVAFGSPILVAAHDNNAFGVWFEGESGWVLNKNGVSQPVADTARDIDPSDLAILGEDAYISGASNFHDGTKPHPLNGTQHAQCWKNGQLIFREEENSNALSIFIHRNDIYLAGHQYDLGSTTGIACYWKNGLRVNLTDGSGKALAKSVFVTDDHVYAAGMIDDQAVYWVDGAATYLTTEGKNSMANSVFVHRSDVHVGGYEHGHPAYWKNGVRQNIPNQEELGSVEFVVVGEN